MDGTATILSISTGEESGQLYSRETISSKVKGYSEQYLVGVVTVLRSAVVENIWPAGASQPRSYSGATDPSGSYPTAILDTTLPQRKPHYISIGIYLTLVHLITLELVVCIGVFASIEI